MISLQNTSDYESKCYRFQPLSELICQHIPMVIHANIHPFPIRFECDYKLCSWIHIRLVSMILLISVVFSRVVRSEYSWMLATASASKKNPPSPPVLQVAVRASVACTPSANQAAVLHLETQSSINQDSGVTTGFFRFIPQVLLGLRGAEPQRQFHWSGQSGSPSLPSQGIIRLEGNPQSDHCC